MDKIYLLQCGEFVKVGRSKNVSSRILQIELMLPYDMELLDCIEIASHDAAVFVEGYIQRTLKDIGLHKKGEWFFLEKNGFISLDEVKKIHNHIKDNCTFSKEISDYVFDIKNKYKGKRLCSIKAMIPNESVFLNDMLNCGWVRAKESYVEIDSFNLIVSEVEKLDKIKAEEASK